MLFLVYSPWFCVPQFDASMQIDWGTSHCGGTGTTKTMTITRQDLATGVVVLLAAGYVVRHGVRWARRKGSPGCGCCSKCPAEPPEKPLVDLDSQQPRLNTAANDYPTIRLALCRLDIH